MKLETAIAIAYNSQSYHHVMENEHAKFYLNWDDLCDDTKQLWIYLGIEVLENMNISAKELKNKCSNLLTFYDEQDIIIFMNVLLSFFELIEDSYGV